MTFQMTSRAALVLAILVLPSIGSGAGSEVEELAVRLTCANSMTESICPIGPSAIARYDRFGGSDEPQDMQVSPDGATLYVAGFSEDAAWSGDTDWLTIAYDAETLETLWVSRYNGPGNIGDQPNAMGVSPDGSRVFVTGWDYGATCQQDIATVAYDGQTGAQLWVAHYDSAPTTQCGNAWTDEANALAVSPDGGTVYVGGYIEVAVDGWDTDRDFAVFAYDAGTGEQIWFAQHGGPTFINNKVEAIVVSPDGSRVFATGPHEGSGHWDFGTVAYDTETGEELWFVLHDGPASLGDAPKSIAVHPDGSTVYVTGMTESTSLTIGYSSDYATVAFSALTGATLWRAYYDSGIQDTDIAHSVAVSHDGERVFITGASISALGADVATVAYDAANGQVIWQQRYDRQAGDDVAYELAVSPTHVFAAGLSNMANPLAAFPGPQPSNAGRDYTLVAYHLASGDQAWAVHYQGPGGHDDVVHALAVAPDGKTAYVTGRSMGAGSYWDYATLAYPTTPTS